nr:MAG TPA: hypothetical protein [Caudoviricetes sp.]
MTQTVKSTNSLNVIHTSLIFNDSFLYVFVYRNYKISYNFVYVNTFVIKFV